MKLKSSDLEVIKWILWKAGNNSLINDNDVIALFF